MIKDVFLKKEIHDFKVHSLLAFISSMTMTMTMSMDFQMGEYFALLMLLLAGYLQL